MPLLRATVLPYASAAVLHLETSSCAAGSSSESVESLCQPALVHHSCCCHHPNCSPDYQYIVLVDSCRLWFSLSHALSAGSMNRPRATHAGEIWARSQSSLTPAATASLLTFWKLRRPAAWKIDLLASRRRKNCVRRVAECCTSLSSLSSSGQTRKAPRPLALVLTFCDACHRPECHRSSSSRLPAATKRQ